MKNKSYKECLKEINLGIEEDMNQLEKTLRYKGSETFIKDIIKSPVMLGKAMWMQIRYLSAEIVKYPAALAKYTLQKN